MHATGGGVNLQTKILPGPGPQGSAHKLTPETNETGSLAEKVSEYESGVHKGYRYAR
jgi:hypothetical protein